MTREPIAAHARILPPYLYDVLWRLALYGPLRASEIADDYNLPKHHFVKWTAQGAANRMRWPRRLGLVECDPDGFWLLTKAGRVWMTTGADTETPATNQKERP